MLSFPEIKALVGNEAPTILEIGANDGSDSEKFLQTFPKCRLFCFEPDPRAIRKWRARMGNRATLIEAAVGAVDGPVVFHMSAGRENQGHEEGWDKSGSLRPPTEHFAVRWPWVRYDKTIEVECMRLDTWAASQGIEEVDFIWADVQGAEIDLLNGGPQTLDKTRYFYTEYLQKEYYAGQIDLAGIQALLPQFELVRRYRIDALFRRKIAP